MQPPVAGKGWGRIDLDSSTAPSTAPGTEKVSTHFSSLFMLNHETFLQREYLWYLPPIFNRSEHFAIFALYLLNGLQIDYTPSVAFLLYGGIYCPHTILCYSCVDFCILLQVYLYMGFPEALVVKNSPTNAGDIRDASSFRGLGRSPRGGHGNPL